MRKQLYGSFLLFLTALIWGVTFVTQSVSMEHIGPFTFNSFRSFLGGAVLIPVVLIINGKKEKKKPIVQKYTLIGGVLCGAILFLGSSLQQIGIQYTTVQKASFISALYIILVPIYGLFRGRKPSGLVWIAVAISTAGLYLLCIQEGFTVNPGDAWIFFSAFLYAGHILVIDHFMRHADGVLMSCIQFFIAGLLSMLCMFIFEEPAIPAIKMAMGPILHAGIMSSGVAYTLQIIAQKNTDPTVASLILSLESVFGALAGWIVLGENFAAREGAGMLLMFGAIILSQLPTKSRPARIEGN